VHRQLVPGFVSDARLDRDDRARFVWIADLLPSELAPNVAALMEGGTNAVKETLESSNAPVR
jgi:hypothetical protein